MQKKKKAEKKSFDKHSGKNVAAKVKASFLAITLALFSFLYLKALSTKKSVAKVTICAPSQTNIFMDHFKGATKFYFMYYSVWSLFCSVRVYISLHFLPILW